MIKIPVLTGATAVGKSDIALKLARVLKNIEIISADAFQVYKYLDIGTAKISKEERSEVCHHLIDILEPDATYNAGCFYEDAGKLIADILNRDKIPLIVGGTGLYIKTLADGIFECPNIDKSVRENLIEELDKNGLQSLYKRLSQVDRTYCEKISENDKSRIIRALEVYIGLGIPFSSAQKEFHRKPDYEYDIFIVTSDRQTIYENINKRTKVMWDLGWKDEVERLIKMGVPEGASSFRAIGYAGIANFIKNGGDEKILLENIAKETRNFAKRQLTWFRNIFSVPFYDDREKLFADMVGRMKK